MIEVKIGDLVLHLRSGNVGIVSQILISRNTLNDMEVLDDLYNVYWLLEGVISSHATSHWQSEFEVLA